jgi:steroid delta-isomerase-like uncharacterized protein
MFKDPITPGSLHTIEKYIAALRERDTLTMQAMRTSDFVLDWVHMDAFEDRPLSREQTNEFWPAWFAGFSEMDYEVSRTIAAESVVVVQWTFTGTHDGTLGAPIFDPALEPTGKTIRLRGISVYDFQEVLIRQESMYIDLATLWVELGVTV